MKIKDVELAKVMGSDGKMYERTPCEVYTRVMGYIRPVSGYNPGKRSEFFSRKNFLESKLDNSDFIRKFGSQGK